jgi:hypothetical protein
VLIASWCHIMKTVDSSFFFLELVFIVIRQCLQDNHVLRDRGYEKEVR